MEGEEEKRCTLNNGTPTGLATAQLQALPSASVARTG